MLLVYGLAVLLSLAAFLAAVLVWSHRTSGWKQSVISAPVVVVNGGIALLRITSCAAPAQACSLEATALFMWPLAMLAMMVWRLWDKRSST